ncbi:MAG: glycosyltransferase [Candidatus Korobacteraceae bacterium]|jgi:hopene-associated glycosyltransferase HpnB
MNLHSFAMTAGAFCVIAWCYLLAARGRFWQVRRLDAGIAPVARTGLIAVIIPARNEAGVIGEAISSLLRQSCAASIHIFIIDDSSTDGTAEAARQAAASHSRAAALTVISGQLLPPGWSGKLWAVQQGIELALPLNPKFLLLTDADIWHSPKNVATLAALAEGGGYELASFMVKLHCRSAAEKLLIPAFVFFFFMLYPPEWIRDPRRQTAGAAGGCILVRPEALARAGGIAAIRNEIIDDCALAAAVKRTGGKIWLRVTPDTHSLRAYGSFAEIERMIARTAFNQLRHSTWLLIGALAGLALTFLLPVGLLFSGLWGLGAAAYLLMFVVYLPMVRFYERSVLWALTLPFAAAFYMLAILHSAVKYWSGRGGEWKGRTQDATASR